MLEMQCVNPAYHASAERIEEARDEWQCTSNEDDDAMRKIYGIHPELFVDYQMDVVVILRQMTFQAQRAVQLNDAARSAKAEFDKVIEEIGKQYDALKSKWERSKTQQTKRGGIQMTIRYDDIDDLLPSEYKILAASL